VENSPHDKLTHVQRERDVFFVLMVSVLLTAVHNTTVWIKVCK
jgi:hypothetical protein